MRIVGIGAGGHARVLLETLLARDDVELIGLLDANPAMKGTTVLGVRVLGSDDLLRGLRRDGVTHAFIGVGGTADNGPRRRLFELARGSGLQVLTVVHPSATVSPSAALGEGTCVCPGAIVAAGAQLGCNVIVNTGAVVEHDCVVGDHAHVASGAVLAGGVIVGEGAHIGAGASVKQGVRIGVDSVVALGAAVIDDVPDRVVVGGVPARPMRAKVDA